MAHIGISQVTTETVLHTNPDWVQPTSYLDITPKKQSTSADTVIVDPMLYNNCVIEIRGEKRRGGPARVLRTIWNLCRWLASEARLAWELAE